jgi:hypothetical protein
MNVFILSTNPVEAAQMQCDRHVVKMVLESAQIMSTVADGPYKPTHVNHPCVVWARANRVNYNWLAMHALALCEEYTLRYGKVHKCQPIIAKLANMSNQFPIGVSEFVQCMPDECRMPDPVDAYRKYYHTKGFAQWNKCRPAPYWWGQR